MAKDIVESFTRNDIVQSFLNNRSLKINDVEYLIQPRIEHQHHPMMMRDMDKWVTLLHSVKGQQVAVIPDYDADGVLSGTLCRVGLYLLGFGDAYIYPPSSFDGYGLTRKSVDNTLEAQPDTQVIITTDNGSNAYEGIAYAKSKGLTVLVTDHHISNVEPPSDASVNPNKRSNGKFEEYYPFRDISGTAVIYKALQAYALKYSNTQATHSQLSTLVLLVGISTVSDMMPLLDENRYFVTESIQMLERFIDSYTDKRKYDYDDTPLGQYYRGVDTLVETLNNHGKLRYGLNADTFGFVIGPILNSPRRMLGTSQIAFEIFQLKRQDLYDNVDLPSDLIYTMNEDRKKYVRELTRYLIEYVEKQRVITPLADADESVFTVATRAGVAGLLSGAYSKSYDLPSVAFSVGIDVPEGSSPIQVQPLTGTLLSGSARSPDWFDLYSFMSQIDKTYPGLIETWGGHQAAAGITIKSDNYEQFRLVFSHHMKQVIAEMTTTQSVSEQKTVSVCKGEFLILTNELEVLRDKMTLSLENTHIIPNGTSTIINNEQVYDALTFFEHLEPFGQGFKKPTFSVVFDTSQARVFYMGADKQHVKFVLVNGLNVIVWNGASDFPLDTSGVTNMVTVEGTLGINVYNGRESIQLVANDYSFLGNTDTLAV